MSDIVVAAHPSWVALPLDRSADVLEAELRERLDGLGDRRQIDEAVVLLSEVARQLAAPPAEDLPALNVSAWVLLADPAGLDLRAFATLRVVTIGPDTTAEDAVNLVLAEAEVFQEPVVERLETRSGDAIGLRYRPMVDNVGRSEVHQVSAVLWPRPERELLYVLSNYCEDLVEAAEIADRLDELGAGIEGL
jgi:hypothetical protein